MAMHGMAEAAQDELVTRYFEQAVAQGMDPFAALELAQTAAGDMLGPLRPAATSEEIYGTASPAERMAAPRLVISDAAPPMRRPEPIATPRSAPMAAPRPEAMADLMVMPRSEPRVLPRPEMMVAPRSAPMAAPRPEPMVAPRASLAPQFDMMMVPGMDSPAPRMAATLPAQMGQPDAVMTLPARSDLQADEEALRMFRQQRQLERDEEALRMFRQQRQLERDEETLRRFRQQRQLERDEEALRMFRDSTARAFNAPEQSPAPLERAGFADSLLRSLGLR